jgi:hypothetical protein
MGLKNRQHQKARRELAHAAAVTTPAPASVPEVTALVVVPPTPASPTAAADVSEIERRERIFATHAHIVRRNYASGAGIRAGMSEAGASLSK